MSIAPKCICNKYLHYCNPSLDGCLNRTKEQTTPDYYPGKSYQRLFDVINESGPTPLISQMQDIIHVVHEDFPDERVIKAAREAITILEPALQAIRDRRPTTAGLGGIEARIKGAIGQLSEALKNIEK